jgi:hypothetical protein
MVFMWIFTMSYISASVSILIKNFFSFSFFKTFLRYTRQWVSLTKTKKIFPKKSDQRNVFLFSQHLFLKLQHDQLKKFVAQNMHFSIL